MVEELMVEMEPVSHALGNHFRCVSVYILKSLEKVSLIAKTKICQFCTGMIPYEISCSGEIIGL